MEIRDNKVFLGGISATQLAEDYGTPVFVMEEDVIRNQYRSLSRNVAYRPLVVHYACKANWNVQVMRVLRDEGAELDACSPGDVHLAIAAGYVPDQILYTGYAVSDDELRHTIKYGLLLNVDSLSQITRYAKLGGRGKIGLRINTDVQAGSHVHLSSATTTSKFGLHFSQFEEVSTLASMHNLTIGGLHTHLGSDILKREPFLQALDVLLSAAERFGDVEYVDLGGGLGVPFAQIEHPFDLFVYGQELTRRLEEWCANHSRRLTLRLEPGEFLVSESGCLLTRVVDIKPAAHVGPERSPLFIGTDTSLNHIFGAVFYETYHDILIADRAEEPEGQRVHICGNLMQAGDVLAKDRLLPSLHEGDVLVIQKCGSYAMCRASRFNGRPLPAEVIVKDGQARLARRRESLDDLLINQILD
jgi:diaminopimelate decarboxylase